MPQIDIAALRRAISQQNDVFSDFKKRELLNFMFMKWLLAHGRYNEQLINDEYPPAADYPVLPPSYEFKPRPVTPTSHS